MDKAALVLGITFIFTAPGYAWCQVLFGGPRPAWRERMAAAVGLSVGLVPLVVFWLSWLVAMPVNLLSTFLVALALSLAPLGLVGMRRWGLDNGRGAVPPGTAR
jgi:uncharacterized membrane protein